LTIEGIDTLRRADNPATEDRVGLVALTARPFVCAASTGTAATSVHGTAVQPDAINMNRTSPESVPKNGLLT